VPRAAVVTLLIPAPFGRLVLTPVIPSPVGSSPPVPLSAMRRGGTFGCQGEYRAASSRESVASASDRVMELPAGAKRGASTVKLSNSGVLVTALIACS